MRSEGRGQKQINWPRTKKCGKGVSNALNEALLSALKKGRPWIPKCAVAKMAGIGGGSYS
jgi:hypothetical protein